VSGGVRLACSTSKGAAPACYASIRRRADLRGSPTTIVRKLVYEMSVSLDGFIAGPNGEIDWSVPDEELHRFHNEQTRELGGHLLGRHLYEEMTYWETAEEQSSLPEAGREFAGIWKALPKVVFSRTLEEVEGNSRLAGNGAVEETTKLKEESGKALAVGGAGLAATLIEAGLVDEFRLFVSPIVLGGGTPYFPALDERVDLKLIESREFGSRVVYLRYQQASAVSA
jgi:dihydrofolate reductase